MNENGFVRFVILIFHVLSTWLWGWGTLSCYYPFLLSARHYVVIKSPVLRKLLISDRLSRSSSTKTRLVDREKLPVIGAFYYIVGGILLAGAGISGICAAVRDISGLEAPLLQALADFDRFLFPGLWLLGAAGFVCYQIDYGVGKYFDPNGGRL